MAGPRCPACGGGFVEELPAAALAGPNALHSSRARADLSLADAWADMRSVLAHRSQRLRADAGSSRSSSPDIGGSAAIAREAASPPTSPSPSDGGVASTRTGRSPRRLRDASRRVALESLNSLNDVLPLGSQHRTSGRRESPGGVFGDYGDGEDGLARFLRDMREESSFLEVATAQLRARSAPMSDIAQEQVRVGDGRVLCYLPILAWQTSGSDESSDDESSDDGIPPHVAASDAAAAAAAGGGGRGEFTGRVGDYFLGDDLSALVDRIATAHPMPHTSTHTPASQAAVRALPLRIVREEDVAGGVAACAVCHEDMGVGAVTQQLPCRHAYHSDCILPWLAQTNTCPVCRFRLPSQAEADAAPSCPWAHGSLLGVDTRQGAGADRRWGGEEVGDGVGWWMSVDGSRGGIRDVEGEWGWHGMRQGGGAASSLSSLLHQRIHTAGPTPWSHQHHHAHDPSHTHTHHHGHDASHAHHPARSPFMGRGPSGAASSDRWPAASAASWRASAPSARPSPGATHMPLHGAAQGGVGDRGVQQGGMEAARRGSEAVRRAVGSSWEAYLMRQRARQLGGERLAGAARQQEGGGGRQGSSAREGMRGDAVQGRGESMGGGESEAGPSVGGAEVSERLPAAAAAAAASDGLAVWRRDLIGAARGTVFADKGERERRWGGGAVAVRGRVQREATGGSVGASGSGSGSGGTRSDESCDLSEGSPSSPPLTPSSLATVLGSSAHGSPEGGVGCTEARREKRRAREMQGREVEGAGRRQGGGIEWTPPSPFSVLQVSVLQVSVLQVSVLQVSVLQVSVVQVSVLQVSVVQVSVLQVSVVQVSVVQVSVLQVSVVQVSVLQVSVVQVSVVQVSVVQVSVVQVSVVQVSVVQVSVVQVSVVQVSVVQVSVVQVSVVQVSVVQVSVVQVSVVQVSVVQVSVVQVSVVQVSVVQVSVVQVSVVQVSVVQVSVVQVSVVQVSVLQVSVVQVSVVQVSVVQVSVVQVSVVQVSVVQVSVVQVSVVQVSVLHVSVMLPSLPIHIKCTVRRCAEQCRKV
ncbi:unnamed protein product [Closterium sp. NIES-65]|nr:unnamed protein product [Closterium sp. NIES-65]